MYDFLVQHSIYVVLSVVLVVWGGIAMYLNRLERRVHLLEQQSTSAPDNNS